MVKKDIKKFADGTTKTQIRVTYGYRDKDGKVKQKTVRSFGYLEDYDNPEEILEEAEALSRSYIKEKNVVISNQTNAPFYKDDTNIVENFGYTFLSSVYDSLDLRSFFSNYECTGRYDPDDVFKYLVINRIMNPDSKRSTYQSNHGYYGFKLNCSLPQLYRSLDFYSQVKTDMQVHLNNKIKELVGRKNEKMFYDVTNYYFEKDYNDYDILIPVTEEYKTVKEMKENNIIEIEENGVSKQYQVIKGYGKKGVSKEHQLTPIVQLGLFMDSNGLPVAMQIFPGNTSDSLTLQPVMKEVKEKFELNRLLVVADKGMNSNDNIVKIVENGDGYMFSQILKGKKGTRFHERLFNESLYKVESDDYKYQIFDENYTVKTKDGKIKELKQKVLIYYSGEDARREKAKREDKVNKAKNSLLNNAYRIDHSFNKYIKENNYIKETGQGADGKEYAIDEDKIKEEEKYDGYFCIVTSEIDMDEKKIRETYHGLWKIEESFRITKSDLEARPIYVRTREHIEAHFLICFVGLLVIRLLQYKMNYSLSVERIIRALNMCGCVSADSGIIHAVKIGEKIGFQKLISKNGKEYIGLADDEITETVKDLKEIETAFGITMCPKLSVKTVFDKFLRNIDFKGCLKK